MRFLSLDDMEDQDERHYGLSGSPTQVVRIFPPEKKHRKRAVDRHGAGAGAKSFLTCSRVKKHFRGWEYGRIDHSCGKADPGLAEQLVTLPLWRAGIQRRHARGGGRLQDVQAVREKERRSRDGEEAPAPQVDKRRWAGVAVFADYAHGRLHPVSLELLGKARELAAVTGQPVYALLLGSGTSAAARELLRYGADKVYVCDDPALAEFTVEPYADAFAHLLKRQGPRPFWWEPPTWGRSLAPPGGGAFRHRAHGRLHHAGNGAQHRPGADPPGVRRQHHGAHCDPKPPAPVLHGAL